MFKRLILFLIVFFPFFGFAHPLHLSITNIDIANDTLKTTIRFFEDDLTAILIHEKLLPEGSLLNDTSPNIVGALETFVTHNLHFKVKRENIVLVFDKIEHDDIMVTINFTSLIHHKTKQIEITNLLMTRYFGDQKNLLIVNYKGTEKGFELDSQKTSETIYL